MPERLDLVDRHQRRLLEIVGAARPLITSRVHDSDLTALRYLRQEMMEALASYARLLQEMAEATITDDELTRSTDVSFLRERCLAMGASYDAFRSRWAHRKALEHWAEYRLSAVHMMKRIRDDVLASRQPEISRASLAA